MSPSSPPSSPSRPVFINRTNAEAQDDRDKYPNNAIPSPHERKRAPASDLWAQRPPKRAKLDKKEEKEIIELDDEPSDEEDATPLPQRPNWKANAFGMRNAGIRAGAWSMARLPLLPSRSILQSFVSAEKSDVFNTRPTEERNYHINLPYACEYTHASKEGKESLLAVSTEQGIVYVLNTAKREEWEVEPQRCTFFPHKNAIFDIKWSRSDDLLATAAADHRIAVSQLTAHSGVVMRSLRYHTSTIKCLAWDPNRDDILCSGSRDGTICVWDLRESSRKTPSMLITKAHDTGKPSGRQGKLCAPPARGVTSLLFSGLHDYGLISAGSYDGILREWDLRYIDDRIPWSGPDEIMEPFCSYMSSEDPTTYGGASRARGLSSLVAGAGPTRGLLFALASDSRVHTYDAGSLEPLSGHAPEAWAYGHNEMRTNSFYVRAAVSPCGRWLASGSKEKGSVFLFDVSGSGRERMEAAARGGDPGLSARMRGVELCGQKGDLGAVDWAQDTLASCADDGTIRVWRPDLEIARKCEEKPEEMKWSWSWAIGR